MRYHLLLLVLFGSAVQLGRQAESYEKCACPCEKRLAINKDMQDCIHLKSVKTKGFVTADKNNMFALNERRYTYVASKKDQYTKWKLYSNSAWGDDKTYALRNKALSEFIYATPTSTRNTFNRFVLTWKKDIQVIPREGFWQFIPAGKNYVMIRSAWSGEFLFVANEDHYQVKGSKRLYTYRHINSKPPKSEGDNAALFEMVRC